MGYVFEAMNRSNPDRSGESPTSTDGSGVPMEVEQPLVAEFDDEPEVDDMTETAVLPVEVEWSDEASDVDDESDDVAWDDGQAAAEDEFEYDGILECEEEEDEDETEDESEKTLSLMAIECAQRPGTQWSPAALVHTGRVDDANIPTQLNVNAMDDRLVALTRPASIMAEEYRSIRTGILAHWEQRRHLLHLITSASPQEGKTLTSLNLGLIFAELHNRKTVVIEADLRLPQFAKLLGLADSPGLVGLLEGQADLPEVIHAVGENRLHVIPCGPCATDGAVQLLSSAAMVGVLNTLRHRYDHVIIDTPPVVDLADAGILAGMSDDVLLVARMNHTPKSLVEQAVRTLASYNAPVSGLLATDHPRTQRKYYYRKYGYRYHDGDRHYHAQAS